MKSSSGILYGKAGHSNDCLCPASAYLEKNPVASASLCKVLMKKVNRMVSDSRET